MARGARCEKRPADVIGAAIMVGRIATGDAIDTILNKDPHAVALGKRGGSKGGKARAKALSKSKRTEMARKAAREKWGKRPT